MLGQGDGSSRIVLIYRCQRRRSTYRCSRKRLLRLGQRPLPALHAHDRRDVEDLEESWREIGKGSNARVPSTSLGARHQHLAYAVGEETGRYYGMRFGSVRLSLSYVEDSIAPLCAVKMAVTAASRPSRSLIRKRAPPHPAFYGSRKLDAHTPWPTLSPCCSVVKAACDAPRCLRRTFNTSVSQPLAL